MQRLCPALQIPGCGAAGEILDTAPGWGGRRSHCCRVLWDPLGSSGDPLGSSGVTWGPLGSSGILWDQGSGISASPHRKDPSRSLCCRILWDQGSGRIPPGPFPWLCRLFWDPAQWGQPCPARSILGQWQPWAGARLGTLSSKHQWIKFSKANFGFNGAVPSHQIHSNP